MFKKALISALLVLAVTSTAWAQAPKVEFSALIGWTLSDGVSGDPYLAGNGKTYDRIDLKDSMNYGFSLGFFVNPSAEIGFLWRRQATELTLLGPVAKDKLADINVDGYHGYGAYYFGDPDAKVHPYIMGGLGMTNYGGISFKKTDGSTSNISGTAKFSSTWGAGVKVSASPKVGLKFGMQWTPTYIKSDAAGWWCDPWFGCYVIGDAQYSNQFEFNGGIVFRF